VVTRLLALDLSLTATGVFAGDPEDPKAPFEITQITTPTRRTNESDVAWNGRRFKVFSDALLDLWRRHTPPLMVVEITSHAHTITKHGDTRVKTSRGIEFRAGLGLGRAIGWLDSVLYLSEVYGFPSIQVETIEAKDAKLRVAGSQGASKAAVAAYLTQIFGWNLDSWKESQVDALSVGLAYLRTEAMKAQEAKLLALAEAQHPKRVAGGV
jgi:hypothetical protein